MKFRRLYWIAEQLEENGQSRVTGVYTSVPDLIHKGLHWCNEVSAPSSRFRLTLVKPDSFNCPLGVWTSPEFVGIEDDLQQFVDTNEYTSEEIVSLQQELRNFVKQEASL